MANRIKNFLRWLTVVLCISAMAAKAEEPMNIRMHVSLMALIANPEKYDGKYIRVIGFMNLEFEGNGLYVHQSDYEHFISKNGIWIETPIKREEKPGHTLAPLDSLNKRYVIMEGTFSASNHGHHGSWSGAIEHVTRLDSWDFTR